MLRQQPLVPALLRFQPPRVVGADQPVGVVQDALARAVIAPEQHLLRVRVDVQELEQVLDPRAPEAIDALVVIAHHGQVAALAGEQAHELELDVVRVLELVHEDPAPPLLHLAPNVSSLA